MAEAPTIATLFRDAAKLLRARFEVIRTSNPHPGDKGAEVEDILRDFLNEHLPQRFRAGSGIVLDTQNALSRQQDVILYDALSSPLYRYAPNNQIVPMDAVVSVIEVKSSLSKLELEDAYEKIASVKRLKKRPMPEVELRSNVEGAFHGTTGIVFAFDSTVSVDAIIDHAKDLNERFESHLWPEMIVVLDKGLISYAIQYPGVDGFPGSLMSVAYPPEWEKRGGPPWYVHLVLHRDGEFTLNRFFVTLLSQLTYFPYRSGVPPFDVALKGTANQVMTRAGYQYNLAGQLQPVPEHLEMTEGNPTFVERGIDVYVSNGGPRIAALQFLPWQDGSVIRAFGQEQVIKGLMTALRMPRDLLLVRDPTAPHMHLTTITRITEDEFKRWPRMIEKNTSLRAQLVKGEKQRSAEGVGRAEAAPGEGGAVGSEPAGQS